MYRSAPEIGPYSSRFGQLSWVPSNSKTGIKKKKKDTYLDRLF